LRQWEQHGEEGNSDFDGGGSVGAEGSSEFDGGGSMGIGS